LKIEENKPSFPTLEKNKDDPQLIVEAHA